MLMKTNPDTNNQQNGTEVNIQIKKTHRIEFLFLLLALYIGAVLYSYIWEDLLADGVRRALDMDAVYAAIGLVNPKGDKK